MRLQILASLGVSVALSACAYPMTTTEQGADSSGLYVTGAPPDARLLVDMADAGLAATYDGKKTVLVVKPGRHHVVVRSNSTSLFDQAVYVGPGSRVKIKVGPQ